MTERRLQQANLVGPAGYVSMRTARSAASSSARSRAARTSARSSRWAVPSTPRRRRARPRRRCALLARLAAVDGILTAMQLAEVAQRLEIRLELDTLYADYAACLDTDALERWPEFFTADCHYRVTSAENYEAGLPLGLIYATSKEHAEGPGQRIARGNIYEPQRYRHLISASASKATMGALWMSRPVFLSCARCRTAR